MITGSLPRRVLPGLGAILLGLATVTCGGEADGGGTGPPPPPPPSPDTILVVAGNDQTGEVGSPLPVRPSVQVLDQSGEALGGVSVTFVVTAGFGSVSGAAATTDDQGFAAAGSWSLGTRVGVNRLEARIAGLASARFTARSIAGPPDSLSPLQGGGELLPVGSLSAVRPSVRVRDRFGNNVAGVMVRFAVTAGGGSISPDSLVSDPGGIATLQEWRLGTAVAANVLEARVAGPPPVVFQSQTRPGPPASMVRAASDSQVATAGTRVPEDPAVEIRDGFGNPVPGVVVTGTVTAGAGQLTQPQVVTDLQGRWATGWVVGLAGQNRLRLASACCVPVDFSATSLTGPPAVLTPVGSQQVIIVGTVSSNDIGLAISDIAGNPVAGVPVTFEVRRGTLEFPEAVSDSGGLAVAGRWTMDTLAGPDTVLAAVAGLGTVPITAYAYPGPVAALANTHGDGQSVYAQQAIPTLAVTSVDRYGNGTPWVPLAMRITGGDGILLGPVPGQTDDRGVGYIQTWYTGRVTGPNMLEITVPGTSIATTFTVYTMRTPGFLQIVAGSNVTDSVTAVVGPTARLTDTEGLPMPDAAVSFTVTYGGGSVSRTVDSTDAAGLVGTDWTLGTGLGPQTLIASIYNLQAIFTATTTAGSPVAMAIADGDQQVQTVNSALRIPPAVKFSDRFGNPVPDVPVDFAVLAGGGVVTGGAAASGGDGVARVGSWTLGPAVGMNTLQAAAGPPGVAGSPAVFTATSLVSSFTVDVRPLSPLTATQQAAFDSARARLEQMIVGDIPDIALSVGAGACLPAQPALDETVDDLIVYAEIVPIDGPGGILGQAGPCVFRPAGLFPVIAVMQFDAADLAAIESSGYLDEVVVHEMIHGTGFGIFWVQKQLITGVGTVDPVFTGPGARTAFDLIGGALYPGAKVPVENSGGFGTRDSHWRESVLGGELMTGYLNGRAVSRVSVGALEDYGYVVNYGAADPFAIGPYPAPGPRAPGGWRLANDTWAGPLYEVGPGGTLAPVPRP